jgi:Fe-S-cluster containining protein
METRPGFPYAFACQRSGNCCAIPGGFVRATEEECAAIAARLGMSLAGFRSRYLQSDGVTLKDGLGGRCAFLQEGREAGCSIYDVRPQQCRDWPFSPRLLADKDLLALVRRTCPGIVELSPDES